MSKKKVFPVKRIHALKQFSRDPVGTYDELRIMKAYTCLIPSGKKKYHVELLIGNQGFQVARDMSQAQGNWMRWMLAKALLNFKQLELK